MKLSLRKRNERRKSTMKVLVLQDKNNIFQKHNTVEKPFSLPVKGLSSCVSLIEQYGDPTLREGGASHTSAPVLLGWLQACPPSIPAFREQGIAGRAVAGECQRCAGNIKAHLEIPLNQAFS